MQTHFSATALQDPGIREADRILRSCVHCGFCNATCPTYQLLGDERDGPRGRIYLIKALLEHADTDPRITAGTRLHLDRCLTCRNCETTCPSGVEYHRLLDIGRVAIEARVPRGLRERAFRYLLRRVMGSARAATVLFRVARGVRPLLPASLRDKVPPAPPDPGERPQPGRHPRRMLILEGCVQPGLSPNTNAAAARVLDRLGIDLQPAAAAGCCGALDYHLNAQRSGLDRARANIDAWWPEIEAGAEAIVQTASGCGAFVKEYGRLLADDPAYAEKAATVSRRARDLVEVLQKEPLERLELQGAESLAFHCPCTLQHAQGLGGAVETVLSRLGFRLTPVADAHLCCGSGGTNSITQPTLARRLRDRKMRALEAGNPERIVTANIGCQVHLASARRTPVRHWIEAVDSALQHQETS
ncbi:glycolate oxidase subunit GlcF [Thioalkalivibrio paradoxus]|uniref:Glycolate oxidase iron-sulfur subunit n=1 Tax=Thioalkalivibrio paradoxus ARh 1 TaxID=713585 RepID=W0DKY6_9GAMM|nr:glycolate oxidase subunit GlcF [Thioalkalivibrio paradoxus]AHE97902.1 glycolate oxidase [Thioalkalivibrio paradoxus ARh 1]